MLFDADASGDRGEGDGGGDDGANDDTDEAPRLAAVRASRVFGLSWSFLCSGPLRLLLLVSLR